MDTPDILIHVHPDLSSYVRTKVENDVLASKGVIAANFDHHKQPHSLIVVYNADATSGQQILDVVKKYDPAASMAGL